MEPGLTKRNALFIFIHFLYLFFFAGMIFSLRAVSSISIAGIFLTGFFSARWTYSPSARKKAVIFFIAGCIACFILTLIAILYTHDSRSGWSQVRLKTGLVVIPLAVYFTSGFIRLHKARLLLHFTVILFVAALFCLIMSVIRYAGTADPSVFFYHELVRPLSQHAVYFSVFIFIALVTLLENTGMEEPPVSKQVALALIIFFSIFLFLLSSKLTIVLFGIYVPVFIIRSSRNRVIRRAIVYILVILLVSGTGILLLTNNPVSSRFNDIIKGDIGITNKDKFDPGDYFNGIQLRLLEWKFVKEILTDNKKWIPGVSPGDAQALLDKMYISKNMYTGEPARHDRGFLGYNTHNQFLQSLLQQGIIGAIVFTLTWLSLLAMAWEKKSREYTVIVILLLVYAWVESILETQYGIILFTFFPLFFYPGRVHLQPGKAGRPVNSAA